jgi:ribonuclease R
VIYDQGLTLHLSSEVEAVAEAFPEQPSPAEIKRRKDLRHLPFVTIDPATAKDFDDAIYVQPLFDEERSQVRGWKLWVAIADVAHFVTEDSLLDKEAMERSATLYLPAQAFPMLPHRLSNDLCSLKPKVDRLAMVAEIEVSFQGDLERARFHEAIIHSQARFTYDQAASLIGALPPQELPKHLSRMSPQVEALRDCARALKRRRQRRGFLSLALAEPRLDFNERGMVDGFKVAPRHEAHEMVEEAMLAANESVAMHCIATSIPALYRIHAPPPDYGVERFEVQSALLGAPLGFLKPSKKGSAKGGGAKGKGGKEAPKLKKMKATDLSRYLKKHEDHPHLELLSSLLLRSMSKAIYEAEPALHFGLGTTTYLHFTSPIRRYPDLWVHRQLKLWLQAQQPHAKGAEGILKAPNMATLKAAAQRRPKKNADRANGRDTGTEPVLPSGVDPWEVAAYASRRERLIVDAERRVLDAYKALFMKEHVGERFEGFICNTSPRGVMVELNDYPIWCSVDQERLPTSFDYDEERFTWFDTRSKRTLTLGMNVAVTVVGVDVIEGKVEVALEGL